MRNVPNVYEIFNFEIDTVRRTEIEDLSALRNDNHGAYRLTPIDCVFEQFESSERGVFLRRRDTFFARARVAHFSFGDTADAEFAKVRNLQFFTCD